MKIGIVVDSNPPQVGGGYTFEEELLRSVLKVAGDSRHKLIILGDPTYLKMVFGGALDRAGIEIVPLDDRNLIERTWARLHRHHPAFRRLRWWLKRPILLERQARKAGAEIVWFLGARTDWIDLPYITVVWDLQHRLQPWFPEVGGITQWERRENVYRWFLQRATTVIVGTQTGKSEVMQFYSVPDNHIEILPHPTPGFARADIEDRDDEVLKQHGLQPGYLFYPAQFWAHKNHINLLLALHHLKDVHGLVLPLLLVGANKGNLGHIRAEAERLGVAGQVRILGFVPQSDLRSLYRQALALTYVSFFGPENLPPLEAFAIGCPVIAADVSGAAEQLADAAIRVNPTDPAAIADAIKAIHDDETLRARLVERGRERANRWTGANYVNGVFGIIDRFEAVRRAWPAT